MVEIKICNVNNLPPMGAIRFIPDEFKGMEYTKLSKGMKIGIKKILKNEYGVYDEDGEPILRRNGEEVTRCNYYLTLDDGTYTTVKNEKVATQIELLYSQYPNMVTDNVMDFGEDVLNVKCVEVMIRYADGKDYPNVAFE